MTNQLASETSPYLLQHAENPVDWMPWGEAALARARHEDRPILLSIGYAACHWCHVMAHESFEDAETAVLMNARFVNVKVDREERPDLDSLYMAAGVAMTGRAARAVAAQSEPREGGFGPAPKFPQPMTLEFLLRYHRRTGDAWALRMVTHTLDRMAAGGMYDQLGGGFARYATDDR